MTLTLCNKPITNSYRDCLQEYIDSTALESTLEGSSTKINDLQKVFLLSSIGKWSSLSLKTNLIPDRWPCPKNKLHAEF